ncbi:uncharacterized protein LOC122085213 isoform X2 [Macadamia integrifolia]|uniref:uncharacterized protein LOC122085213 isoform X2 n=1 Tax=Macadamia integrifolia TaxID=60698 RepID=UPI001C4E70E1|nr:uncharacterized protein LOC122085213 isoform X2 [Macadamia integrifolia]
MEDPEDQMTIAQFSKTRQQLPPPHTLKRKRNAWRKRNPNLLRFWNSSPPLSSPNHNQVVPDQGEKNRRRRMYWSSVGANSCSMKQAKELQKKLVPEKMPTCVKFMCPTYVGSYFWMRLPLDFCKLNLPKEDCVITLVDENCEEYETKYIPGRAVLSGGWRAFSVAHKLVPKDTVLFQLIKATKLKVYILREKVAKKVILNTSSDGSNSHSMKQAKELRKKLALEKMPLSSDAANSHSMKQAKELRKKLALEEMPTCMKFIRPSHVSGCFWLRLPVDFCKLNLPKEDCIITLVDERGEEYEMKYVAERVGIGGGWRAFSVAHKLVPKDTVLFQLIKATKFKVYILRENVAKKETLTEEDNVDEGASHHLSDLQKKNQNAIPPGSTYNPGPPAGEQFENES